MIWHLLSNRLLLLYSPASASDIHPDSAIACPLCQTQQVEHYHSDKCRSYWHCQQCDLVFVDKTQQLSCDDEKAIYQQHENGPEDEGYRRFLNRMAVPIQQRLPKGSKGLDFGCGPGPTLSLMLEEQGYQMSVYDLYFADHPKVLQQSYDFITSTEVFEHLAGPKTELERLLAILNPGGYLGIMTKRVLNPEAFSRWHYKNDQTHITFFSENSFHWLAQRYGLELEIVDNDVVLLRKPL